MILKNLPVFEQGDRIQVQIPKQNLEFGAGEVYSDKATGTVIFPHRTDDKGFSVIDEKKVCSMNSEGMVLVIYDKMKWTEVVPEWLLEALKPEDDPLTSH